MLGGVRAAQGVRTRESDGVILVEDVKFFDRESRRRPVSELVIVPATEHLTRAITPGAAGLVSVTHELDNGLYEGQGRGSLYVQLNTARAARWSHAGAGHRGDEVGPLLRHPVTNTVPPVLDRPTPDSQLVLWDGAPHLTWPALLVQATAWACISSSTPPSHRILAFTRRGAAGEHAANWRGCLGSGKASSS